MTARAAAEAPCESQLPPDRSLAMPDSKSHDLNAADWYYDEMPGPVFAAGLHALRAQGSVVPVRALGGTLPVHYIVGYDALARAFRDGERFPPAHAYQIISQPFIGETFMSMDEPRHREWRPAMTPAFRRSEIDRLEESEIVPIGHELIDRFERDGEADLVAAFAHLFAFAIICRQLGLPAIAKTSSTHGRWT